MAILSMTGFGSAEAQDDEENIWTCEIKSLNGRYLEINSRIPKQISSLEPEIVSTLKKKLTRGRVDLSISCQFSGKDQAGLPSINRHALDHYLRLFQEACQKLPKGVLVPSNTFGLSEFTRLLAIEGIVVPGIKYINNSQRLNERQEFITCLADSALTSLMQAREREGQDEKKDILELLKHIDGDFKEIRKSADAILKALTASYQERLITLIKSLEGTFEVCVDESPVRERLIIEAGVMAEKCDIHEELSRFDSHLTNFRSIVNQGGAVGRKLDFLCQEMHREATTMGNKLHDRALSERYCNIKVGIERIRQQIQNIE